MAYGRASLLSDTTHSTERTSSSRSSGGRRPMAWTTILRVVTAGLLLFLPVSANHDHPHHPHPHHRDDVVSVTPSRLRRTPRSLQGEANANNSNNNNNGGVTTARPESIGGRLIPTNDDEEEDDDRPIPVAVVRNDDDDTTTPSADEAGTATALDDTDATTNDNNNNNNCPTTYSLYHCDDPTLNYKLRCRMDTCEWDLAQLARNGPPAYCDHADRAALWQPADLTDTNDNSNDKNEDDSVVPPVYRPCVLWNLLFAETAPSQAPSHEGTTATPTWTPTVTTESANDTLAPIQNDTTATTTTLAATSTPVAAPTGISLAVPTTVTAADDNTAYKVHFDTIFCNYFLVSPLPLVKRAFSSNDLLSELDAITADHVQRHLRDALLETTVAVEARWVQGLAPWANATVLATTVLSGSIVLAGPEAARGPPDGDAILRLVQKALSSRPAGEETPGRLSSGGTLDYVTALRMAEDPILQSIDRVYEGLPSDVLLSTTSHDDTDRDTTTFDTQNDDNRDESGRFSIRWGDWSDLYFVIVVTAGATAALGLCLVLCVCCCLRRRRQQPWTVKPKATTDHDSESSRRDVDDSAAVERGESRPQTVPSWRTSDPTKKHSHKNNHNSKVVSETPHDMERAHSDGDHTDPELIRPWKQTGEDCRPSGPLPYPYNNMVQLQQDGRVQYALERQRQQQQGQGDDDDDDDGMDSIATSMYSYMDDSHMCSMAPCSVMYQPGATGEEPSSSAWSVTGDDTAADSPASTREGAVAMPNQNVVHHATADRSKVEDPRPGSDPSPELEDDGDVLIYCGDDDDSLSVISDSMLATTLDYGHNASHISHSIPMGRSAVAAAIARFEAAAAGAEAAHDAPVWATDENQPKSPDPVLESVSRPSPTMIHEVVEESRDPSNGSLASPSSRAADSPVEDSSPLQIFQGDDDDNSPQKSPVSSSTDHSLSKVRRNIVDTMATSVESVQPPASPVTVDVSPPRPRRVVGDPPPGTRSAAHAPPQEHVEKSSASSVASERSASAAAHDSDALHHSNHSRRSKGPPPVRSRASSTGEASFASRSSSSTSGVVATALSSLAGARIPTRSSRETTNNNNETNGKTTGDTKAPQPSFVLRSGTFKKWNGGTAATAAAAASSNKSGGPSDESAPWSKRTGSKAPVFQSGSFLKKPSRASKAAMDSLVSPSGVSDIKSVTASNKIMYDLEPAVIPDDRSQQSESDFDIQSICSRDDNSLFSFGVSDSGFRSPILPTNHKASQQARSKALVRQSRGNSLLTDSERSQLGVRSSPPAAVVQDAQAIRLPPTYK